MITASLDYMSSPKRDYSPLCKKCAPNLIGALPSSGSAYPENVFSIDSYLEAKRDKNLPTYDLLPLDEAASYFEKTFILATAKQTCSASISYLRKPLERTRENISDIVNNRLGIGNELTDILNYNTKASTKEKQEPVDYAKEILDPIARRVFQEARANNRYGLKEQLGRFKDIYINNIAREFGYKEVAKNMQIYNLQEMAEKDIAKLGIGYAALSLGISTRSVRDKIERYWDNPLNNMVFEKQRRESPEQSNIKKVINMEKFKEQQKKIDAELENRQRAA